MVDIPNYFMGVINQLTTGGAPPCTIATRRIGIVHDL